MGQVGWDVRKKQFSERPFELGSGKGVSHLIEGPPYVSSPLPLQPFHLSPQRVILCLQFAHLLSCDLADSVGGEHGGDVFGAIPVHRDDVYYKDTLGWEIADLELGDDLGVCIFNRSKGCSALQLKPCLVHVVHAEHRDLVGRLQVPHRDELPVPVVVGAGETVLADNRHKACGTAAMLYVGPAIGLYSRDIDAFTGLDKADFVFAEFLKRAVRVERLVFVIGAICALKIGDGLMKHKVGIVLHDVSNPLQRSIVVSPIPEVRSVMTNIKSLFVTPLYQAALSDHGSIDTKELAQSCDVIADDDEAGQAWCEENEFPGYTSYASLSDLPWRFPIFKDVVEALDKHVAAFAEALAFDLADRKLALEDIWINILPEGGIHTAHIHPHSVISGTTYVAMPEGTSAIKFEDPRLPMMMAAPGRLKDAPEELRQFVYVKPAVGDVLLWESWLRHEVPMNMAEDERISVSFNYKWE